MSQTTHFIGTINRKALICIPFVSYCRTLTETLILLSEILPSKQETNLFNVKRNYLNFVNCTLWNGSRTLGLLPLIVLHQTLRNVLTTAFTNGAWNHNETGK